jgi:dTDP-4-amino-4,6-dideoxygalactose transaminase
MSDNGSPRIYLSPPHMSGRELSLVREVFDSNWIAPLGPQVNAFEEEFAEAVGAKHALALGSGTAGLHLALQLAGVSGGDEVMVSTLTFAASVNPVLYLGGYPTFIDSERVSWNMDPGLLGETVEDRARKRDLPKAVVLVHLYGQAADIEPVKAVCDRYEIPLIEDAAEALGATYSGSAGSRQQAERRRQDQFRISNCECRTGKGKDAGEEEERSAVRQFGSTSTAGRRQLEEVTNHAE